MFSNRKWLQLHFLLFLDVGEVSSNLLLHVLSCKNLQEERLFFVSSYFGHFLLLLGRLMDPSKPSVFCYEAICQSSAHLQPLFLQINV